MGRECQKCGYERTGTEPNPDIECPSCGAIYHKVEAALAAAAEQTTKPPTKSGNRVSDSAVLAMTVATLGVAIWASTHFGTVDRGAIPAHSTSKPATLTVSQAEYGDEWPYTIPHGTLRCERSVVAGHEKRYVTLTYSGVTYGINGTAMSSGRYWSLSDIWRDNPDYPGAKVPDPGIIQRGLTLCR